MQDVVSKIEELTTRFKALNKGLNLGRKMQVLKKLETLKSKQSKLKGLKNTSRILLGCPMINLWRQTLKKK